MAQQYFGISLEILPTVDFETVAMISELYENNKQFL
jgi:hypothetical protein